MRNWTHHVAGAWQNPITSRRRWQRDQTPIQKQTKHKTQQTNHVVSSDSPASLKVFLSNSLSLYITEWVWLNKLIKNEMKLINETQHLFFFFWCGTVSLWESDWPILLTLTSSSFSCFCLFKFGCPHTMLLCILHAHTLALITNFFFFFYGSCCTTTTMFVCCVFVVCVLCVCVL